MSDSAPRVSSDFAVEAERLLASGDVAAAVLLCDRGIQQYPDYATGYLMLAMAYLQDGNINSARSAARRGLRCAPGSTALQTMARLPESQSDHGVAKENQTEGNVPETASDIIALEELARTLQGAKIPALETASAPPPITQGDELLVSPTLARIYEAQGLIGEAIAAYRLLAAQNDGAREKYLERIAALESKNPPRGV